jgi:hypothetical protein
MIGKKDAVAARAAVLRFLRTKAADLPETDREDLASDAIETLLEKATVETIKDAPAYAVKIAAGLLANALRDRKRLAEEGDADVGSGTTAEDLVLAAEAPTKRRTRAPRARRFAVESPELWEAVRAECRQGFQRRLGTPFPWSDERALAFGARIAHEHEARKVLDDLRRSLGAAVAFVEGVDGQPTPTTSVLATLVSRIGPLPRASVQVLSGRSELARLLDTYNLFGLPTREDGSSRFLTDRELALVSLLVGNRPQGLGGMVTVGGVVEAERKACGHALERHGAKPTWDVDHEAETRAEFDVWRGNTATRPVRNVAKLKPTAGDTLQREESKKCPPSDPSAKPRASRKSRSP